MVDSSITRTTLVLPPPVVSAPRKICNHDNNDDDDEDRGLLLPTFASRAKPEAMRPQSSDIVVHFAKRTASSDLPAKLPLGWALTVADNDLDVKKASIRGGVNSAPVGRNNRALLSAESHHTPHVSSEPRPSSALSTLSMLNALVTRTRPTSSASVSERSLVVSATRANRSVVIPPESSPSSDNSNHLVVDCRAKGRGPVTKYLEKLHFLMSSALPPALVAVDSRPTTPSKSPTDTASGSPTRSNKAAELVYGPKGVADVVAESKRIVSVHAPMGHVRRLQKQFFDELPGTAREGEQSETHSLRPCSASIEMLSTHNSEAVIVPKPAGRALSPTAKTKHAQEVVAAARQFLGNRRGVAEESMAGSKSQDPRSRERSVVMLPGTAASFRDISNRSNSMSAKRLGPSPLDFRVGLVRKQYNS